MAAMWQKAHDDLSPASLEVLAAVKVDLCREPFHEDDLFSAWQTMETIPAEDRQAASNVVSGFLSCRGVVLKPMELDLPDD